MKTPPPTTMAVISLALCLTFSMGCINLSKLTRELAKDPAALKVQLTTIHGSLNVSRAGSNTNSIQITSQGEIVVNPEKVTVQATPAPAPLDSATLLLLIELLRPPQPTIVTNR